MDCIVLKDSLSSSIRVRDDFTSLSDLDIIGRIAASSTSLLLDLCMRANTPEVLRCA
jgi:hypothetical protein